MTKRNKAKYQRPPKYSSIDKDNDESNNVSNRIKKFGELILHSFNAITSIWTDSKYIVVSLFNQTFAEQFKQPLKRLIFTRLIWLIFAIAIELAVSFPYKYIINALEHKDETDFYSSMRLYLLVILFAAPISSIDKYLSEYLCVKFREATTKILVNRYHQNYAFFHFSPNVDNPGQRLVVDVNAWVWAIVNFATILIRESIRLCGWISILYYIGATSFLECGFIIAILICVFAIIIFAGRLTAISFQISMHASDFRAGLIRTKTNGETIAFYGAASYESNSSIQRFMLLMSDLISQSKWESGLHLLQKLSGFGSEILPLFLLFPQFLAGKMELGEVMQCVSAFTSLMKSLTLLVSQMNRLSQIQSGGRRVAAVIKEMENIEDKISKPPVIKGSAVTTRNKESDPLINNDDDQDADESSKMVYEGIICDFLPNMETKVDGNDHEKNDVLITSNLSIIVPNTKSLLLYKLNMTVVRHQNLLIVGPSGCGKSSLLRVLSGLWKWGGGTVKRLDDSQVMFLPQRPYLPILDEDENTLKNQLLFPKYSMAECDRNILSTKQCLDVLNTLNLSYVLDADVGIEESQDWSKALSLGEQQRLGFGRVVVAKPKMAFLDESTSALDVDNQRTMYQLLQKENITYLSVGHRLNLVEFHDTVLEVIGDGSWKLWTREEYLAK